jgi:hypothetical protein
VEYVFKEFLCSENAEIYRRLNKYGDSNLDFLVSLGWNFGSVFRENSGYYVIITNGKNRVKYPNNHFGMNYHYEWIQIILNRLIIICNFPFFLCQSLNFVLEINRFNFFSLINNHNHY